MAYTDTGLQANKDYYYRVSAVNAIGESEKSASVTAKPGNQQVVEVNFASEPDGTLTIINSTKYDMVLFHTTPSLKSVIGGVYSYTEVVKDISKKVPDFNIGGPMVIRAMKKSEYDANIADLSKGRIEYSAFAAYGQGKQFRAILTSEWDGEYSYLVMNRLFNRGVELRKGSKNGEKIAYLSAAASPTPLYATSLSSITIYPVYVAYNTQSKSLVYYESNEWKDTQEVAPRLNPTVPYQFPPIDIDANSMFNTVNLPYATIVIQNNATRVANVNVGLSQQTAQSNNPQMEPGAKETFDIEGGAGNGTQLALNFTLVTNQVTVNIRFAGSSELPRIKNGYIYNVTLNYTGTDIMNPAHYSAVIEEGEAIDTSQFLIAQ
jgi:hypothetical protein